VDGPNPVSSIESGTKRATVTVWNSTVMVSSISYTATIDPSMLSSCSALQIVLTRDRIYSLSIGFPALMSMLFDILQIIINSLSIFFSLFIDF
jgi:hypothetical protein